MPRLPLSLRLTGAQVLRDGDMQARSVVMQDGRIAKGPLPEVDLTDYLILPGIIDLHGDAFERHISPRPSAPFPIATGLAGTDRDAAANGVTTAYLAQSWSWEGGSRGPDYALQLLAGLDAYRPRALIDLRVQIRCETHTVDTKDRLLAAVQAHRVGYVVFNNHLDEAVMLAEQRPHEVTVWARKAGRTPDEHMALVHETMALKPRVPRYLCRLAEEFDRLGVVYGSHDDPDANTREHFSMIGAKIFEFPTSVAAAEAARAVGDPVLMGAPNVVRGGSQSGNVSALHLVRARRCDALVSDYYYPALSQAAFRLVDEGVMPLPRAWDLISKNPAEILRLPDRGRIDYGRRADLTVIHAETRQVEATFSAGRLAYLGGGAAERFLRVADQIVASAA